MAVLAAAALAASPIAHARRQVQARGHEDGAAAAIKASPYYAPLSNPTGGDQFMARNALQQTAQSQSDKMFSAIQSLLGGTAPGLNFVPYDSPLLSGGEAASSANVTDYPGGPKGTINVAPAITTSFVDPKLGLYHDAATYIFPHEMSHLRQLPSVLASVPVREGGAQAFADIVSPFAARAAGVPLNTANQSAADGGYEDVVAAANARGRDWLLYGQFGKPAGTWP